VEGWPECRSVPWTRIWTVALFTFVFLALTVPSGPAVAASVTPREIATTDEEAGRQAVRTVDKDGADARSIWVRLRWERDQESADATTGPATIENVVWVAKDLSAARAIYQEQSARHKEFPESFYAHKGTYALPISSIGDDVSGLSACLDCNAKEELLLHHRVTFRRGVVVATLYLYGPEAATPQSLMMWYATQVANRVPDAALRASEDAPQASSTADASPAATSTPASASVVALIVAEPKNLAVRIGEAGKGARATTDRDGTDARGSWYEVRFEREGSGGRFYQGPVVVHNVVYVARDLDGARLTYQEQVALNDKLPEAERRVGQKFGLKDADEVGEEGAGISACERSCNASGEVYVHKRIVSRIGNVVSVVYLWGLSHEEGTSDWHARYFEDLVVGRSRAAAAAVPI
jgi:hypothetical protein